MNTLNERIKTLREAVGEMTPGEWWADNDEPLDGCTWTSGNEPCSICPRRITALHMCGLLQEELR